LLPRINAIQKARRPLFLLGYALFAFTFAAHADPTATLMGRITDRAGAVISGATVAAVNVETNTAFSGLTNHQGFYNIPNISPGRYRVLVQKVGWVTIVKPGLELHVQDEIALNFSMHPGSVIESVSLQEGAPLIQGETLGITIGQRNLTELPSLTRNPYDFIVLSPGATPVTTIRGIGFAVSGQRAESGNFLLDGSDNNNAYVTGPGQGLPLDAVQEYRLQAANFTAEYGRNTGFIANVVSKAGTNDIHGVAYDFLRNSALAANTYDNKAHGLPKPVFSRHQGGGTIGLPIKKDKLFFFGALESVLVTSNAPVKFYVPTPELLAISSSATRAIFQRFSLPTHLSVIDVRPRKVCAFGAICSGKAGLTTLPAFAATSRIGGIDAGAGPPQTTYIGTARVDYNIASKTLLAARYAFQDMNASPVVEQPYSPELDRPVFSRNENVLVSLTHTFSVNLVGESRLVYNRVSMTIPQVPAAPFPYFIISGEGSPLPGGSNGEGGPQNGYQVVENAHKVQGKHSFKFGGEYLHLRDNRTPSEVAVTQHNRGQFRDLQAFVNGTLSSFQISLDPKGHVPGQRVEPPFGPSTSRRHYRFNDFAAFFQDTWAFSSRLTVSSGLRYEYFGEQRSPGAERALDANFYYGDTGSIFERIASGRLLRTIDAPGKYRNHFYLPNWGNFGPRVGFSYDLTGDGKTVFQSGFGVFYNRLLGFGGTSLNPPSYDLLRLTGVPLTPELMDDPYSVLPAAPIPLNTSVIFHKDQNLKTAYTLSWNAGLERQLGSSVVFAVTYVGSSGNRLYQFMNENRKGSGQFVGRPGTRLVENTSFFSTLSNLGHSSYHSLQLSGRSHRIGNSGPELAANYTLSHSIDNVSSVGNEPRSVGLSAYLLDPFHPSLDKGSSDHDVRHRFVTGLIWELPVARNARTVKRDLLAGWEMSAILSFQTGQPFSLIDSGVVDRDEIENTRPRVTGQVPSVLRGRTIVADTVTPNAFLVLPLNLVRYPNGGCVPEARPFACELSVNGPFAGTLRRNSFPRPGMHSENVAVLKNLNLPIFRQEGLKLQFRAEFYNLLNHSNLYVNSSSRDVARLSWNTPTTMIPGVTASFGTPERLPQEARQIVLGLKVLF
jgi:hypothetical protein